MRSALPVVAALRKTTEDTMLDCQCHGHRYYTLYGMALITVFYQMLYLVQCSVQLLLVW